VLEVMERLRKYTTVFYSTHILDDVQRVSDTVAIMNHGELVAYGPIQELLSGGDGNVFTVTLKGDVEAAQQRLAAQSWVAGIQEISRNGASAWNVRVTDAQVAETHLLRLLLVDEQLKVTEFRRKQYQLEDIFMQIVEGGQNVRK